MRILDIEKYPDQLCVLSFGFDEGCNFVKHQVFEKPKKGEESRFGKVDYVEKARLPKFVRSFWNYVFEYDKIPTFTEFSHQYVTENRFEIRKKIITEKHRNGLRGRAFRAYTSIVRECLFPLLLKEDMNCFDVKVIYNTELDIDEGVDVLLIYNDKYYGFNLFLGSPNSWGYRKSKEEYRHKEPYSNVDYTDLPCPVGGRVKYGPIWMYDNTDLNIVRKKLELPIIKRKSDHIRVNKTKGVN